MRGSRKSTGASGHTHLFCASTKCPTRTQAMQAAVENLELPMGDLSKVLHLDSREAFRDVLGHSWCPACKHRGLLLNYGAANGYPKVYFDRFAIGNRHEAQWWTGACTNGSEEMIGAALAWFGIGSEEGAA